MATSATRMQTAAKPAQSISQSIAEHVVGCGYSALPASSITAAKRLILDTLAVGWAGTSAPGAPEAHGLLTEEGGRGDSSLWGFGGKLPVYADAILAALAARELKRPVKVVMTRQQMFEMATHRAATLQRVLQEYEEKIGKIV